MKIEKHENKLIGERTKIPKEDIKKYFYIFDDQRTKNLRDSFAKYLFGYMKSIPDQRVREFVDEWFDFFEVPQSERNYYV